MTRLIVHVEGPTEETFVNEILARHLYAAGYELVSARIVGNARQRMRRGGIKGWDSVQKDICRHLRCDIGSLSTTMVDYYALPQAKSKAWPGRAAAATQPFARKAVTVESALHEDICGEMGSDFDPRRFIPFVMMHEFEAMLFSDCETFAAGIGMAHLAGQFQSIRDGFATPEEINDSPLTAPSKRIEALVPNYEKPFMGACAAIDIGLEVIRQECPHFNEWIQALESRV